MRYHDIEFEISKYIMYLSSIFAKDIIYLTYEGICKYYASGIVTYKTKLLTEIPMKEVILNRLRA